MNKPLSEVGVQLYRNDSLKDYSFSDFKGNYSFKAKSGIYVVKTSSMLYESISKNIEIKGISTILNFILKEKNTILDEVVLKIDRDIEIRKDTIIFKASAFKNKRQLILEDLLKDIPGIQVSSNGTITFQGKLVTNVKIENDDLFNGGYKILTKNLKADLVDRIQLLQNYSENPLLKNIRDTEDVAINITLKEDRKANFFGDFDVFSNYKNRHDNHTNLISFLKKSKHYFIADYNTTGKDFYLDFKNIFASKSDNPTLRIGSNQNTTSFTKLNTVRPNIDNEYVNLNDSQLYNFNSIYKLHPKVKVKVILLANKNINNFIRNQTTIFTESSDLIINEGFLIKQKENLITGKVDLDWEINKKSLIAYDAYYSLSSLNGISDITLPDSNVNERTTISSKRTNHFLNYTKKLKNNSVIQLTTRYIFDNKPQDYFISPFSYKKSFGEDFDLVKSETLSKLNYFTTQFSYIKNFKSANIESYLGYHNKKENLNSKVLFRDKDSQIFTDTPPNYSNNLLLNQSLFYIRNKMRKKLGSLDISLNLDLNFEKNNNSNFDVNNFFYLNSFIHLKKTILKKHEFNLTTSIKQFTNPLSNLNLEAIPMNYRNFTRGLASNELQKYYDINFNYIYGNWNDKFTGGFNAKFTLGDKYLSFNSIINEEITEIKKIILEGKKNIQAGFYFDRFINFLSSNIKFKTSYFNTSYANLVNNIERSIRFNSVSNEIEIRSNFTGFFDFHLGYSLNNSSTSINKNKISVINKKGFVDFDLFSENFTFNFKNDLYFFDPKSKIKNYIFSNINNTFKVNKNFSIQLKVHNLFNNKTFDIFSQTDLFQFTSQTPLLERYVLIGFNYRI